MPGDVISGLAAVSDGSAGAWEFIEEFAGQWRDPLRERDGWDEETLRAAERRLGVRLPAAMSEAYGLFGRRGDLTSLQDELLPPGRLAVDGEVLVFRRENQGCTRWGVRLAALDRPDPPVVFRLDDAWVPFLDRFSLACVEMVLSESLFADPVELGDNRDLDEPAVALLEEYFVRLSLPGYPMWTGGGPVRWYAGADAILRADAGTWLWVRARTGTALDAVRAVLPGDWLMTEQAG